MAGIQKYSKILTEEDVKRTAIRFLKGYYKYRPRLGDTKTSMDMRGQGGIVADGYLTFQKEDQTNFTATFEATASDTEEEVRYQLQPELLAWDSTVFAFLGVTFTLLFTYLTDIWTIPQIGLLWRSVLIAVCFVGYYLLANLYVLKWFRRYRYIYAIEQFKQYHADEQWIALADNVFPNRNNTYYRELRKQCIYNGFGLIMIYEDGSAQLMITPARTNVFGLSRRIVQFLSVTELTKRFRSQRRRAWAKKFTGRLKNWLKPYRRTNLMRFQRTYQYQFAVSCICMLLCGSILYREWQDLPIRYINEKAYARKLAKEAATNKNEVSENYGDSVRVPFGEQQGEVPLFDQENDFAEADYIPEVVFSVPGSDELIYYDCARIVQSNRRGYILQESMYADLDQAEARIRLLADYGLQAHAVWSACFRDGDGYTVFLDQVLTDSLDALSRAAGYEIAWPDGIVLPEFQVVPIPVKLND